MARTVEDVQEAYAQAVSALTPAGYTPVVALLDGSKRKKRKNAAARNWDPSSGSVSITFAKVESPAVEQAKTLTGHESARTEAGTSLAKPLIEAIRALDAAERSVSFVALKWFRDQFLPGRGVSWAGGPYSGQAVIKEAIDRGLFFTSKVPNPKTPAFPTTAIRLNRQLPAVQKILGSPSARAARAFQPVEIAGEPLSATVIRARR